MPFKALQKQPEPLPRKVLHSTRFLPRLRAVTRL